MTIDDLKSYIESETAVPVAAQRIHYNGNELRDGSKTLQQCQVTSNAMLGMSVMPVRNMQNPAASSSRSVQQQRRGAPRTGISQQAAAAPMNDPETIRLQAAGNPDILARIRESNPDLASAVHDPVRFRQIWDHLRRQQEEAEAANQRRLELLNSDPFNIDAQTQIEEMIRQGNVMENLQSAMENDPAVFFQVTMLYIPVEVNNTKVKAFVDSGAQTTIMSPDCAERCGIYRLLDTRYSGTARGVGTAKILGRVHSAMIKIGDSYFSCSFTVMEGKDVDLLLGLDMLKKHQACIDLRRGKLVIHDNEVDFLGEADIPKHGEVHKEEPTVEGPSGRRIGAVSGTVTQAGSAGASSTQATNVSSSSSASGSQPQFTIGPASFPKEDIERVMNMGCSREEAIHALEMVGGNVELAAGLLFE